jgi:hypothetical protein
LQNFRCYQPNLGRFLPQVFVWQEDDVVFSHLVLVYNRGGIFMKLFCLVPRTKDFEIWYILKIPDISCYQRKAIFKTLGSNECIDYSYTSI